MILVKQACKPTYTSAPSAWCCVAFKLAEPTFRRANGYFLVRENGLATFEFLWELKGDWRVHGHDQASYQELMENFCESARKVLQTGEAAQLQLQTIKGLCEQISQSLGG